MSDKCDCPECKAGAPDWMVTYGDLVTLLMCFFVLLFAFSEIDAQKFEAVMQSFQGSAGILQGGTSLSENPLAFDGLPENDTTNASKDLQVLSDLKIKVEQELEEMDVEIEIQMEMIDRGLVLRIPDNALFDSAKADLKVEAERALDIIGHILLEEEFSENFISIEGHTDNIPIKTQQFPSNWELSTTRAINVIRYFLSPVGIDPERLSASGYGEYYPLASNETSEGRSKNRRVDIVIIKKFFNTSMDIGESGGE